jgi:hypothetical protein
MQIAGPVVYTFIMFGLNVIGFAYHERGLVLLAIH